jgi:hypothetical protein
MRKHLLAACLLLPLPAAAQSQLIGSWSMVSAIQTENGQSKDYFGPHPLGQLMFGTDRRFSDQLIWENAAASGGGSVKQIYERVK